MNFKTISRYVGFALLVSALFMFISILISVGEGNDSALAALIISFTITFIFGVFPLIFVRRTSAITLKDGFMIIVLSWLLSFVFGMLPYALWGGPFDLANAWFESVSGFTTTGATILRRVEALPDSLLFWRSATHFIGGLGVVVFLLLIIPGSNQIRLRLTNMELSSLSREGYRSRTNRTVYIFAYVYIAITVLAFVLYVLAGMPVFDAVCHAFSVGATGGFSTRTESIAAYGSFSIELVTLVMMLLSSIHFGSLYIVVVTRSLKPLKNTVLRFYLSAIAVVTLIAASSLVISGAESSLHTSIWHCLFQSVATASTTGFAVTDNALWPVGVAYFVLSLGLFCGCAGSTTGGVKIDRAVILWKSVLRQVQRTIHPSEVSEVKISGTALRNGELHLHLLYICLYITLVCIFAFVCMCLGVGAGDAFSTSLAAFGNVGPAVGGYGTMSCYELMPDAAKFVLTVGMFLGRVEIYPVLAAVAMIFDRRR